MTSNCSFLGEPQEPFRRIADVAVVDVFELGVLNFPDFYFTGDDYRYHFEPGSKTTVPRLASWSGSIPG